MNGKRRSLFLLAVSIWLLAACTPHEETESVNELTWQEAKAEAQEMATEIAAQIPRNIVLNTDQRETGVLMNCDNERQSWTGATTVALTPGTMAESVVRDLQSHFENDERFSHRTRRDIAGAYELQLMSRTSEASYIVAEDAPGTIRISAWSPCFRLPEGVYPGGKF
ncbi:MAG: hypothetical protein J7484_07470 [Microbacterium sp.]|nr:hypothetical protein [Microbacterium sp.]